MFYNKSINDIEKELGTSIDGLSSSEVEKRKKEYGKINYQKRKKMGF